MLKYKNSTGEDIAIKQYRIPARSTIVIEEEFESLPAGVTKVADEPTIDFLFLAGGTISFDAADDLTVEKKTSAIKLREDSHAGGYFLLAIKKPQENTAGDLTIYVYNIIKIDGAEREVLHTTHTVEKITGADTYRDFLIQGLFVGERKIKIGAKFAADSGAIDVEYKLYRL